MPTIKQSSYEPVPTGDYSAKIGSCVVEASKYGEQVRFRFDITTRGLEEHSVFGFASATFSPSSKLFKWTQAAFGGRTIPRSYDLDTEDLLDRAVMLTLVVRELEDGRRVNKIDDVRPITNARPGPVAEPGAMERAGAHRGETIPHELPDWLREPDGDEMPF